MTATFAAISLGESGKLTADDVRLIRNEAARGVRHVDLAKRFAIAPNYVSQVVAGKHWKDTDYIPGCPLEGGTISVGHRHYKRAAGDYRIAETSGCWLWLRRLTKGDVPVAWVGGRDVTAARAYYERAYGDVAKQLRVARTCGNVFCVNPRHGRVSTLAQASSRRRDGESKKRAARALAAILVEAAEIVAAARAESLAIREQKRALWFARSLDVPLGPETGAGTLSSLTDAGDADPLAEIERDELAAMLDGLDEETIANLDEAALLDLRERLLTAGFAPSTSMTVA